MKFFIAAYEEGNFLRASQILGTVQSNVSFRIRKLETTLGGPLFERERHGVRPTPKARKLYRVAKRVVSLADEAATTMKSDKAA